MSLLPVEPHSIVNIPAAQSTTAANNNQLLTKLNLQADVEADWSASSKDALDLRHGQQQQWEMASDTNHPINNAADVKGCVTMHTIAGGRYQVLDRVHEPWVLLYLLRLVPAVFHVQCQSSS